MSLPAPALLDGRESTPSRPVDRGGGSGQTVAASMERFAAFQLPRRVRRGDGGDASGRMKHPSTSAGGRAVAGSNPVVPRSARATTPAAGGSSTRTPSSATTSVADWPTRGSPLACPAGPNSSATPVTAGSGALQGAWSRGASSAGGIVPRHEPVPLHNGLPHHCHGGGASVEGGCHGEPIPPGLTERAAVYSLGSNRPFRGGVQCAGSSWARPQHWCWLWRQLRRAIRLRTVPTNRLSAVLTVTSTSSPGTSPSPRTGPTSAPLVCSQGRRALSEREVHEAVLAGR